MDNQLPWHVRDKQLVTTFPKDSSHVVVHEFHDPGAHPSSPPYEERWESEKEPIGSGGQGQVFLQRRISSKGTDTQRAVKVIPLRVGGQNKTQNYRRELETTFRFSDRKFSKYFVKSIGWYLSKSSGRLFIAMEYLAKGDLQTYLDNSPPLSEGECREIVRQVVTGLRIMHKEGFAHRDVKPANILIQQSSTKLKPGDWWVKLADFGISKQLEATATGKRTVCGTPGYWPPEIVKLAWGETNLLAIDYPAADMWALGIMTFRMMAGATPFPSTSDVLKYAGDAELFPRSPLDNEDISSDGITWIRELLHPSTTARLASDRAISHDSIRRSVPDLRVILAASHSSSTPSSSASPTGRMSFEERGLTTALTELSDTTAAQGLSFDEGHQVLLPPTVIRTRTTSPLLQEHGNDTRVRHATVPSHTMRYACTVKESPCDPGRHHSPVFADSNALIHHMLNEHVHRDEVREKFDTLSAPEAVLNWAAYRGHDDICKLLLELGADPKSRDVLGCRLLATAASRGHDKVVEVLLKDGADLCAPDKHNMTPLALAASRGYERVARLLLENGADIETRDTFVSQTPLAHAASSGRKGVARLLCDRGAALETCNIAGQTPLALAVENGHEAVVRLLCDRGAALQTRDDEGQTPLALAAAFGHEAVARLLCDRGADLQSGTSTGQTPLSLAAMHGHEAVARLLCDRGAALETCDKIGQTPLGLAAHFGHEGVAKLLLENRADIEASTLHDCTPLALAVLEEHAGVVKLLLASGANPKGAHSPKNAPLSRARSCKNKEILKLLQDAASWKRKIPFLDKKKG